MNLLLMTSSLQERYVFRSTSNFRSSSSSDAFKLPFVQFFALFCSFRTYKWSQSFCLWSCTLEQILAYPINKFLIPCYHSKHLRIMLNTSCSNNLPLFDDDKHWYLKKCLIVVNLINKFDYIGFEVCKLPLSLIVL